MEPQEPKCGFCGSEYGQDAPGGTYPCPECGALLVTVKHDGPLDLRSLVSQPDENTSIPMPPQVHIALMRVQECWDLVMDNLRQALRRDHPEDDEIVESGLFQSVQSSGRLSYELILLYELYGTTEKQLRKDFAESDERAGVAHPLDERGRRVAPTTQNVARTAQIGPSTVRAEFPERNTPNGTTQLP
jgi:hypothetical protein